jgi:simple sugar transport system permease protein
MSFETVGLPAVLLVMYVVFTLTAPNFLTVDNQLNILQNAAFVGILAFGMTLVIIAAEIDISVGSAVALSSALLGVLVVKAGLPTGVAVVLVLLEGAAVGCLAGAVVAGFGVPSLIVTLALFSAMRGAALLLTNAYPILLPEDFSVWGSGHLVGVPIPALFLVAAFAVFWFVAARTAFGRSVYAVGGNAESARLSGLPVTRVRVAILGITGLLSAFVGVLQASRLGSADPNIGIGLEFEVISAVIIGGTSLFGGRGTMFGTLIGVLFITVLPNGMVLRGVNPYAQQVVLGGVVLGAVLISSIRTRRGAART